ncbi:MAG: nicotinate-nucleotide adenylyltransferase [Deltaproteobacteria bacterium]|nr:nicotinate-nucleotide adenylyltransferase [Deltaproteobacteria bacterium]
MIETGVIHGRFQILHNDHLKYLMAGKARCRHLIVGITNPDPSMTGDDLADPIRSRIDSNPLTYYERYVMMRDALNEAGLSMHEFSIIPFPINFPEAYKYYVPLDATFFLTIYDDWGRKKLEIFQSLGLKTEILWEISREEKGLSGDDIRRKIASGGDGKYLVPASTWSLVQKWGIPERLANMYNK